MASVRLLLALGLLADLSVKCQSFKLFTTSYDSQGCGRCGEFDAAEFEDTSDGDVYVGCVSKHSNVRDKIPKCPTGETTSDQAAGHVGTIFRLKNGLLAKMMNAFDDVTMDKGVPIRHIEASRVEYEVYMEMWCLKKLTALAKNPAAEMKNETRLNVQEHPLKEFALETEFNDGDPWAPSFHGVCQMRNPDSERPLLFLVIENMLASFEEPCQVDLKLGTSTVEPETLKQKPSWSRIGKVIAHTLADSVSTTSKAGVRLAGYKVFDRDTREWKKMQSKMLDTMASLNDVFNTFFDKSGHRNDQGAFEYYRDRVLNMAGWWQLQGETDLRAIALSLLMAYECQDQGTPVDAPSLIQNSSMIQTQGAYKPRDWKGAKPRIKLIDYAHFFAAEEKEDWPSDGVQQGLLSVVSELERKRIQVIQTGVANGYKFKCANPEFPTSMTEKSCLKVGALGRKKYVTWMRRDKYSLIGECRTCDVLKVRNSMKSAKQRQAWRIYAGIRSGEDIKSYISKNLDALFFK